MVLKTGLLGPMISMFFLSACVQASEKPAASDCKETARVFLMLPSEEGMNALAGSREAACWLEFESSNTNGSKLNGWVERGNRWAAQYLATHVNHLEGGNGEDALIALGMFSEQDMESLFVFAKHGLLTKNDFHHALTMLPLSLADDLHAQLNALNTRRAKVSLVARKDLSEQKQQALTAIDEFAAELKVHISINEK